MDFAAFSLGTVSEPVASAEGYRRLSSSMKLALPLDFKDFSVAPYYSRAWKDRRDGAGSGLADDAARALADFADSPVYYASLPFAELVSASRAEDFTSGYFRPVITDPSVDAASVKRVLLCSGKITWDLFAGRQKSGREDVAIVRLERLYPLPADEIRAALGAYPDDAEVVWVQEEPMNQGAFQFISVNLPEHLDGRPITRVSRPPSASPATGSHKAHDAEQAAVVAEAIGG